MAKGRIPKRVYQRNRSAEKDGPELAQAEALAPTRIRLQLSLYAFESRRFEIWRGAASKAIVADAAEALDLFLVLKTAMQEWWNARQADRQGERQDV